MNKKFKGYQESVQKTVIQIYARTDTHTPADDYMASTIGGVQNNSHCMWKAQ